MSLSINPPFFISVSEGYGESEEFIVDDEETMNAVVKHLVEVRKWHPWYTKTFVSNVDLYVKTCAEANGVYLCGGWDEELRERTAKLLANVPR
jgi:hypothetical protein